MTLITSPEELYATDGGEPGAASRAPGPEHGASSRRRGRHRTARPGEPARLLIHGEVSYRTPAAASLFELEAQRTSSLVSLLGKLDSFAGPTRLSNDE